MYWRNRQKIVEQAYGYLINVRLFEWRAYLGMSLLGYLQGLGNPLLIFSDYLSFTKYLVTVLLYLAFSFAINNCFDYEGDKLGDKISKNPVASGIIGQREGVIQSVLIALTGVTLTFLWFDGYTFGLYFVMILLSGAYSIPPLRLKSVPFMDMMSHGLFFGALIILYGISVTQGFGGGTYYLVGSIFVFSLILELRNHIDDAPEDYASNVDTTVTKIGLVRSNKLLYALNFVHFSFLLGITSFIGFQAVSLLVFVLTISLVLLYSVKANKNLYLRSIDVLTTLVYVFFVLKGIII